MNAFPGQVHRSELIPSKLWPENTSSAFRIRYQTTMLDGSCRETTGSVFLPRESARLGRFPVLSYVPGTTGFVRDGAPSVVGLSQPEREHLSHWLYAGYVVCAADYEHLPAGEQRPFYISDTVATDVIDIVRAVHHIYRLSSRQWLIVGFSKGGDVALRAANIATAYAPELQFCGSAAIAPIVSVTNLFDAKTANGCDRVSPGVVVMLVGISASHSGASSHERLNEQGSNLLAKAGNATMSQIIDMTKNITNDMVMTTRISRVGRVRRVLNSLDTSVSYLDCPVFIAASQGDNVSMFPSLSDYATGLARAGTDVHWSERNGGAHVGMLGLVLPESLQWAERIRG